MGLRRLQLARNIQLQLAVGRHHRLGAGVVAVVTRLALLGLSLPVVRQFGRQDALGQLFLAGQPRIRPGRGADC